MQSMSDNQRIVVITLAVLLGIICLILIGVGIYSVFLQPNPPTSTPTPSFTATASATMPPPPTSTPQALDPVWDRIQAAGKLVVGISADYPPFSYIANDFTIQGFDLEMIKEIGERLNIPLDVRNMAFDGLLDAIQLKQIDVAIAAISVTPQRDAYVDFTNVYFVGEDAVIAYAESAIAITRVEDLAMYRVGVQLGSVYQTWLQDVLVDPGLMPPQYLVAFQTPEDAVRALTEANPRVQLVVIDFLPAEVAERALPVKIIARNLNPQLFSIAFPQGAVILGSKLNQAIGEMQNDGTLGRLAKDHQNIDYLIPLPTPAPTQPPATPETCLDGMTYIADINYDDNNMTTPPEFSPGQNFQKGWRIQNSGTCVWDSKYILTYVGAAPPNSPVGGNPVVIQGVVNPGQMYDIYVNLTAPTLPGIYQSFWQLRSGNGLYFGDRLYAGFRVVGQPTITPPPAPVIRDFRVTPRTISEGGCVNLNWSFDGIDLIMTRIFRGNEVILFDIPTQGIHTDCPPGSGAVDYQLVIDSRHTGSTNAIRTILVIPAAQPTPTPAPTDEPPPMISFFDSDHDEIDVGQCITLTWSFNGYSIANAQISRGEEVIAFDIPNEAELQDCPPEIGQVEYTLKVDSEFSGSAEQSFFVSVIQQALAFLFNVLGLKY